MSRQAARIGRAAFLFPAADDLAREGRAALDHELLHGGARVTAGGCAAGMGWCRAVLARFEIGRVTAAAARRRSRQGPNPIVPTSSSPTLLCSVSELGDARDQGTHQALIVGSSARLRAMAKPTREEAWELFCEWTESDSLRKHALGGRGRDGRLRGAMRTRTRSATRSPAWSTTSTTSATPTSTPATPAIALEGAREARLPAGRDRRRRRPRDVPRRAARDADGEDAVRGRRALRLHRRLRARAARPGSRA